MANHLHLQFTLLELDTIGNLGIFSNGKSIYLSSGDVSQLIVWLSQEQRENVLRIGEKRFHLRNGALQITGWGRLLTIPRTETDQAYHWLKTRQKNLSPPTPESAL